MTAVALRRLAETEEERTMSLEDLAWAIAVREHSRLHRKGMTKEYGTPKVRSASG